MNSAKLDKIYQLYKRGATEGEKAAAKNRLEAMLKKEGMTFEQYEARFQSSATSSSSTNYDEPKRNVQHSVTIRFPDAMHRDLFHTFIRNHMNHLYYNIFVNYSKKTAKTFVYMVPEEDVYRIKMQYRQIKRQIKVALQTIEINMTYAMDDDKKQPNEWDVDIIMNKEYFGKRFRKRRR